MGLRCVVSGRLAFATATSLIILSVGLSPAEARHRHHFHHRHRLHHQGGHGGYSPPFSDIVVDAKTGRVLSGVDVDAPRHPASLTKVMTLYLLFDQMAKGHISLNTELTVSRHAASMAPTKLGVPAGSKVPVDAVIKSIVTQSANDMAVVIAEKLGGSEPQFAKMMTAKAHQLGMTHTNYADASGLPNAMQLTTARDTAILGRAIQDSFPQYYHYFSVRDYTYAGHHMRNHNHMLNYVEGMDGIKTGFTNASGFNLLTSVHRDGRRIVSVVLGGTTWRGRDAIMAKLISNNLERAGTVRTARLIRDEELPASEIHEASAEIQAKTPISKVTRPVPLPELAVKSPPSRASSHHLELAAVVPPIDLGEDRQPPVRRFQPAVISAALKLPMALHNEAADTPKSFAKSADLIKSAKLVQDGSTRSHVLAQANRTEAQTTSASPAALGWVAGPVGHRVTEAAGSRAISAAAPQHQAAINAHPLMAKQDDDSDETSSLRPKVATIFNHTSIKTGWMIQIGATDSAELARGLLDRAKSKNAKILANAQSVTEKAQKGNTTIYRARFGGLQMASAQAACKSLKHTGFSCFALKN